MSGFYVNSTMFKKWRNITDVIKTHSNFYKKSYTGLATNNSTSLIAEKSSWRDFKIIQN